MHNFILLLIKGTINYLFIPSVAFSKTQDLSFPHLVIICPAYATDRCVNQTVKQDYAIKLNK